MEILKRRRWSQSVTTSSLDMPVVRASTDVANSASVRVLEKLGFRFVRRSTVGGLPTLFYEMRPSDARR